ncbi:unnamed protein product [Notodromas monacha]|uniref:choline-phosphate cytidylyltransferase n=1 Tax=Notodromas monacha TaxID=399045 RepID=A0A7R9GJJ7_9CRUS|nr:unnamed protein product [Notodromas monacha]CAG0923634.1 unnamed protein product [Notodromas monacha]
MKRVPVQSEQQRCEALRHCPYVDEVCPNLPFTLPKRFMQQMQIDFVAHDDAPYVTTGGTDLYHKYKQANMMLATKRADGISTTDIINRIIKKFKNDAIE